MAKVYVTRLSGANGVLGVFASLELLKKRLVASGEVSRHFADQLDSGFINHNLVTIDAKGFEPYTMYIQEVELISERPMAIATLSSKEQKLLLKHGHAGCWEVALYDNPNTGFYVGSACVECTKCGEVLVELIGGREQDE